MSTGRRSSLLNIDEWLDKCPNEEPDSMIYDPDYPNEIASLKAKQMEPELLSMYRVVVDNCTEIGLSPKIIDDRLADIDECILSYWNTIKKDVQDDKDKLSKYRQGLLNEIAKINSDLHLPAYVPDENNTLVQDCKRLKTKFMQLNDVKQKRLHKLQQLQEKQIKLCSVLGIEAPQIKTKTDIPSDEELTKLSGAVVELEKEEKRRIEKYHMMKDMISKCIEQVEYTAQTDVENRILSSGLNLAENHLREMSNLHSKLETLYAKNLESFKELKERLVSLHDRLDVGQEERDAFFESHSDCKPSLMIEMELEIERYEELKRQNIGKFIDKIKQELVVEYERCYISQEQQDNFFALSNVSGECNEELLDLYERELDRIKKYYEDNKDILDKFQKWRMMWKELIELEVKANDPNRFNNRGGQLLLEEKKRKALQKGLPKVEQELTALNEAYTARNSGDKFKIFDSNLDEFIAGCWDELNNAKEEEKRERQRAKLKVETKGRKPMQAQVVLKRTPTKRAAAVGITPTPSKLHCQRSILGTPSRSNQLTMSGSVKKSAQKSTYQPNISSRSRQPSTNGKSHIPVFNSGNDVTQRDKTLANSNGSDFSALSLSEQEFEDIIVSCPASAKRAR